MTGGVAGGGATDSRLLRLADGDNVLIASAFLPAGEELIVDGVRCRLDLEAGTGFKVAACDLAPGDVVLRLGIPIGEITAPVACGALVHVHNLKSRYLRTHNRGEA
jgi:hypothetical protein